MYPDSLLLLNQQAHLRRGQGPPFCHSSPCFSPSSTMNVSSTSSPSWTTTAESVCPLPAASCVRSSWTPGSGTNSTSAPRVSWGRTTLCWDHHCATWLSPGTPAGYRCATLRTGGRARFRGISAAVTKALSAVSWPMSATCECLWVDLSWFVLLALSLTTQACMSHYTII